MTNIRSRIETDPRQAMSPFSIPGISRQPSSRLAGGAGEGVKDEEGGSEECRILERRSYGDLIRRRTVSVYSLRTRIRDGGKRSHPRQDDDDV